MKILSTGSRLIAAFLVKKQTKGKDMNNFAGLLTVLFIGLKLTGYITWSWWLVTLPLWGGLALVGGLALIAFFVALTVESRK